MGLDYWRTYAPLRRCADEVLRSLPIRIVLRINNGMLFTIKATISL
jgi:hypothetical protein